MSRTRNAANPKIKRHAPARSIESRENQMIGYAMDLVEKRLLDGSATSQETVHFLKLGTTIAKLEREKLIHENELLQAKKASLESSGELKELYNNAIKAMQVYSGLGCSDEYED